MAETSTYLRLGLRSGSDRHSINLDIMIASSVMTSNVDLDTLRSRLKAQDLPMADAFQQQCSLLENRPSISCPFTALLDPFASHDDPDSSHERSLPLRESPTQPLLCYVSRLFFRFVQNPHASYMLDNIFSSYRLPSQRFPFRQHPPPTWCGIHRSAPMTTSGQLPEAWGSQERPAGKRMH